MDEKGGGWLSGLFSSSKSTKTTTVSEPQSTKSDKPKQRIVRYAGRPTASSPATGSKMQHLKELKQLLDDSLSF